MKYSEYTSEDIVEELQELCSGLGRFPTASEARKSNHALLNAIYKSGKNLRCYQAELGYVSTKVVNGYWKDFDNLSRAIRPLTKNGVFPTVGQIAKNISGGAREAIRDFGGISKVAERMGYCTHSFYKASDGHLLRSSLEFIFDEYLISRGIEHEVDQPIIAGSKYRYDFKINDLYVEIWGVQGRQQYIEKRKQKEKLYSTHNLRLLSLPAEIFMAKFEKVEGRLDLLMEANGTDIHLKASGVIRQASRQCGFWNEFRIMEELETLIKESGQFPAQKDLKVVQGLTTAVTKHGGMNHFRKLLGFPQFFNNLHPTPTPT